MAVIADMALSVASKVAGYLVAPVGRQCGYMMFSNSYVRQLNDEVEKLDDARDRVQHSVDIARNNMKRIERDVERWVKDGETVANKARDVLAHDGRAKKTCFCGWLPNPKERYCLGRDAWKTVQAIQAHIRQGKFERVHYESSPPGHVAGAPDVNSSASDRGNTITDSRASIFQGIIKALDDENLKVIGVYGPGGVGKTTLLEQVEKKLKKEGRPFHMIIKAKVSQIPILKNIQDEIADALKLDLKDVQSEGGRGNRLLERLQRDPSEKVLIILDDLWDKLDLKAVGIPSGNEGKGCTLLLTSRFKDVLEQKMHADRTFRLEGLKHDEAFRLFEKTVGDKLKDEDLKEIAAKVIKKLAGLPLLIISVASTLKYSQLPAWRNALIKIDESNIETIVQLSYDHLKSEDAKSLFLLCGLIGGTIRIEILLVLGMGLGLFERFNNTIEDSRDRLYTTVEELRSACLLLDGGDDKDSVTIHDLYSEVVISTPFRGQNSLMMNSNYGSWSVEKLDKCWAICLVNVGSDRLAELMRCGFPDLKILMLSQPGDWYGRPTHRHDVEDCCRLDFTCMKELQVLYLRSMHITPLPSSMEILKNLRSLYLDHCHVENVAILGDLKALQILSFAGSTIPRLPKEMGKLTNLRLLNLNNCKELQIIEVGVLKCLINLEELHMKGSFDRWTGKDGVSPESCNARLVELKSLKKLTSLEISFHNPTILLEDGDLPFGNLIKFWISIGNYNWREFEGLRTMKIKLEGCNGILSKDWVQKTLQKTQYLHLDGLREFKENAHELCMRGFPQLKHLNIKNSPSIKYIASSFDGLLLTPFMMLESLYLSHLINLENICHGLVGTQCFSKLNYVSITCCNQLKNLWCLSEKQRLVQLEEIKVYKCDSMRGVVIDDVGEDKVAADNMVELPNVRHLKLQYVPNMMSFCRRAEITSESAINQAVVAAEEGRDEGTDGIIEQPPIRHCLTEKFFSHPHGNKESVTITSDSEDTYSDSFFDQKVSLPSLERLVLNSVGYFKRLWYGELPGSSFCKLADLSIWDCPSLLNVFPSTIVGRLHNLQWFSVLNCPSLESLFDCVPLNSNTEQTRVLLPNLLSVHVKNCPSLKSLFDCGSLDSNTELSLSKLTNLSLEDCPSLLNVFPSTIVGRLHNLKWFSVRNCPSLESLFDCVPLNSNTEQTRILLPNLLSVHVSNCPSLKSLFDCGSLDSNTELSLPKLERVMVGGEGRLRHAAKSDSQMVLGFPSLKEVTVEKCSSIRYLFPNFMATTLKNLESIRIINCEQMKEVIPEKEGGQSKAKVMSFPCLQSISLGKLDNLICFGSGSCSYNFASLKYLNILQCHNLQEFIWSPTNVEGPLGKTVEEDDESPRLLFNEMVAFPNIIGLEIEGVRCKELWNNRIPEDSFCKLEYLKLKHCDDLLHIAPSYMWKRLQRCLRWLYVISCRSIEIIYESDGTDAESGKLEGLYLRDLDNLRHIWQSDARPNIPFPELKFIEAVRCSRLEILFANFTAKFLGQIKRLVVESCENMELIAGHEECEEATGATITFSELMHHVLISLPKFRSTLAEKYSAEFPSLQLLNRASCGTEPDQVLGDWESFHKRRCEFSQRL